MVVKQMLEPDLEPIFLPDSYGYRPGKSALDAVAATRERCWRYDWVLEFDIKGLLESASYCPQVYPMRPKSVGWLSITLIRNPLLPPLVT